MERDPEKYYEILKGCLDEQEKVRIGLESKATFLFGAVVVFLGLTITPDSEGWRQYIQYLGIVSLVAVLMMLINVLRPRKRKVVPKPSEVYDDWERNKGIEVTLVGVIPALRKAYEENQLLHESLARRLIWSFIFAMLGIVSTVVCLVRY